MIVIIKISVKNYMNNNNNNNNNINNNKNNNTKSHIRLVKQWNYRPPRGLSNLQHHYLCRSETAHMLHNTIYPSNSMLPSPIYQKCRYI